MTSHGVSRHGRYERLLRKHRLDTRANGGQESTLDSELAKTARTQNLHDEWAAMHSKRQHVDSPSTGALPNPQTATTADSDLAPTATMKDSGEKKAASEPTNVSSDSDQKAVGAPSTTDSDDAPTTVTAITTVTTIVPYPNPDSSTEPAVELTTTAKDYEAVAIAETASDARSTTESKSAKLSPAATEVATESATNTSPTELASAVSPTTEASVESVTDVASLTVAMSDAISQAAGIIATLSSDIEALASPTEDSSAATATSPETFATVSTSVPLISQPAGSSDDASIIIGSSLDLPTALVSTQSPSSTSTEAARAIASDESSTSASTSTSSSDTSTDSTDTSTTSTTSSITSTTTTTTSTTSTTTSSTSQTTHPDSPSQTGGSGWGGGSSSEGTGASPDSNASSNSGPGAMTPQTTGKIVGGVVGGIAAVSLIFLLILFLLRRRRKTGFFFGSPANRSVADDAGGGGLIGESSTREMVSRDSNKDTMFGAAYFAPAFMKRWRQSQLSTGTGDESFTSSTTPSERGFHKVSGRKLPSGMQPGFEYGGFGAGSGGASLETGSPTTDSDSGFSPTLPPAPVMSRSPFSSHKPPPTNPFSSPLDTSFTREAPEDDVAVLRPSPARIPTSGSVTMAGGEASTRPMPMPFPMPPSHPIAIPKRPDALGRSHPSYDGSRGSRFTESL